LKAGQAKHESVRLGENASISALAFDSESIVPRKQLYTYIIITIVAVALGLFSGVISVWLRHRFFPGAHP
jgi:hypothetical protein